MRLSASLCARERCLPTVIEPISFACAQPPYDHPHMSSTKSGVRPTVKAMEDDAASWTEGALAVAPRPLRVLADRWELIAPIGEGGTSTVWRARDRELQRDVAVKMVAAELRGDPHVVARFSHEIEFTKQLEGPSFVELIDHGVFEDRPYIVMTLLHGQSLHERLMERGRLAPLQTVELSVGIARGLDHAHALELVHRDLKPGNLFYAREAGDDRSEREVVKILDFGIAKDGWGTARLTQTGAVLGTAPYMSPEQIRTGRMVDHRSDLWSAAVVVYRALTGVLPFSAPGVQQALRIVEGKFPPASRFVPRVPAAVDAFFATALDLDPDRRFQSAGAMADAYAEIFAGYDGAVVSSKPPSFVRQPSMRPTAVSPTGYDVYAALASSAGRTDGGNVHETPTAVAPQQMEQADPLPSTDAGPQEPARVSEVPTMTGSALPSRWMRPRASLHEIVRAVEETRGTRWGLVVAALAIWLLAIAVGLFFLAVD